MPIEVINDPEEWERLTGSRGSVYISFGAPPKLPESAKKSQEVYLCPQCLEICTSPRQGVLRCDPCGKEWR